MAEQDFLDNDQLDTIRRFADRLQETAHKVNIDHECTAITISNSNPKERELEQAFNGLQAAPEMIHKLLRHIAAPRQAVSVEPKTAILTSKGN